MSGSYLAGGHEDVPARLRRSMKTGTLNDRVSQCLPEYRQVERVALPSQRRLPAAAAPHHHLVAALLFPPSLDRADQRHGRRALLAGEARDDQRLQPRRVIDLDLGE